MPESTRLAAVAAHGLAGSRNDLPGASLSDLEWFDLVQGCVAADLVGFLAAAATAGHLPVTPGQADELAALDAERAGSTRLVERRAVTVAAVLAAAGIDHRIVDGPARRLAYGDADMRHVRCVQVLVPGDRLPEAEALQGPPPVGRDGRPAHRRERLVLRAALVATEGSGDPPAGGQPPSGLAGGTGPDLNRLGSPARLALDGREVAVLDLEQQLVVACADVAASPAPTLALLRDIAQIALSPALDGGWVRRLAESNKLAPALAQGVARAWSTFDLADKTELSVWALRMGGGRRDRPAPRPAPAASRPGLAQRVLGRRQPGPAAGLPPVPPSMTDAVRASPARSHRSSRR